MNESKYPLCKAEKFSIYTFEGVVRLGKPHSRFILADEFEIYLRKQAEELASAPVVWRHPDDFWSTDDGPGINATHTAKLVCITPFKQASAEIPKPPVKNHFRLLDDYVEALEKWTNEFYERAKRLLEHKGK